MVVCAYAWENCYPESSVAVVNADGSGFEVLAQGQGYARPTWSPDGATLAFAARDGIWTVSANGSGTTLLIPGAKEPAWAPDGTRIAFVRQRNE